MARLETTDIKVIDWIKIARREAARQLFEEIDELLIPTSTEPSSPIPNFYIRETGLKALKDKWLKK